MVIFRRITQIVSLTAFSVLFLLAAYPLTSHFPVQFFLQLSSLNSVLTLLTARAFLWTLLPGLVLLVLTFFLGRFFCGWICPLGASIDYSDALLHNKSKNNRKSKIHSWRRFKFYLLIAVSICALFTVQIAGWFDPISIFTRTTVTVLYPLINWIITTLLNIFYSIGLFEDTVFSFQDFLQSWLLPITHMTFIGGFFIAFCFSVILLAGTIQKRFWCRNVCPLGALLGVSSLFRWHKRHVTDDCTNCGLCFRNCRMGAIREDFKGTDHSECINCMDCEAVCPVHAIHFGFFKKFAPSKVDFSKRAWMQSVFAGVTLSGLSQIGYKNAVKNDYRIRPPGAVPEDKFLDRCIRCGECIRVCSTSGRGLQFTGIEFGWEGLGTPQLLTPQGYCEYNCNLCGQVCPTQAIQKLPLAEKQDTRMGTAHFDKTRCIPWYYGEDCLVCEEHCPLPDKAIKFVEKTVATIDGQENTVKLPYVDESLCIGCGICTTSCPLIGKRGIYLTNENENRRQA